MEADGNKTVLLKEETKQMLAIYTNNDRYLAMKDFQKACDEDERMALYGLDDIKEPLDFSELNAQHKLI